MILLGVVEMWRNPVGLKRFPTGGIRRRSRAGRTPPRRRHIGVLLRFRVEENHAVSGDSCHGALRSLIDLMHRCRVNRGQDQKHGADDEGCRWDYDGLERWTWVGFERGMRLRKAER